MAQIGGVHEPLMKGDGKLTAVDSDVTTVAKAAVTEAVRRRSERARACYSFPISMIMYVFFCVSYVWHTDTTIAYTFESAIVNNLVYGSGPGPDYASYYDVVYDRYSFLAWLRDGLLPAMVYGDGTTPTEYSQIVGGFAVPLGGVRLLQQRADTGGCADGVTSKLYPGTCYNEEKPQTSGAIGNSTEAESYGTPASAFTPTTLPGDRTPSYQLLLSTVGPVDPDLTNVVDGLSAGGWADGATTLMRVQAGLLNAQPNVDRWATVSFDLLLTRGGTPRVTATVGSFPCYAYGRKFMGAEAGVVLLLDLILVLYTIYLLVGSSKRAFKAAWYAHGLGAKIRTTLLDPWRLIDYGATLSLISVIVTWSVYVGGVEGLRDSIDKDSQASAAVYMDGTSRPGFIVTLLDLQAKYASARLAGAWALIFLAIRQFKYLQYQPRLAVMSQSLAMSITDGVAFSVLFLIVLSCYGVWGLAMFGSQAPDWQDPHVAITSLFRFMMYDYDLPSMEAIDTDMARLYFASYMLLVTNMTLWMFLAIFLESYTEVRAASHMGTGMIEDALTAAAAFFEMALTCPPWRKGGCCSRTKHGVASCDSLLDSLERGPLASQDRITLGQLQSAARSGARGLVSGSGADLHPRVANSRHVLRPEQVKQVWDEAKSIETQWAEGGFASRIPTLTGLSSEEENPGANNSSSSNGTGTTDMGYGSGTGPDGLRARFNQGGAYQGVASGSSGSSRDEESGVQGMYGASPRAADAGTGLSGSPSGRAVANLTVRSYSAMPVVAGGSGLSVDGLTGAGGAGLSTPAGRGAAGLTGSGTAAGGPGISSPLRGGAGTGSGSYYGSA